MKELYDVLVIGGGIVGSAVARELSRYRLRIGVLEKNLDVCNETSGRNSGVVHGGFAYDRGSLKAKLCVEGNRMMGDLAKELDFRFIRCGKVLVGNTDEDMETLKRTIRQGEDNGASGLELIDEKRLHELVPAVVGKFAMYSKNSGIVDPFGYTIALAENAHANGAEYHFGCEVTDISRDAADRKPSMAVLRPAVHLAQPSIGGTPIPPPTSRQRSSRPIRKPRPRGPSTSRVSPAFRRASHAVPSPRTSKTMRSRFSPQPQMEMGRRSRRLWPHFTWTN